MPDINMQTFVRECKKFKDILVKEEVGQNLIHNCEELIQDATEPLMLMVMGEFSTGKSTFINALLGQEVTVVNATPTTAVITKLCYGPKEKLLIRYKDGHDEEVKLSQFKQMTAGASAKANKLHERIAYVERHMPMEILHNLTIIDSPGLNASVEEHTQATNSFIGKADVVFWMFSADQAITQSEIDEMSKLDMRLKPVAIMNKMDMLDEEEDDPEEFLQENADKIRDRVQTMIGISAKMAFEGQSEQDEDLQKESGLQQVRDFIDDKIMPNREEYKRNTLLDDINAIATDLYYFQKPVLEILDDMKDEDYASYMTEKAHLMKTRNQFLVVIDPLYRYMMAHTARNSTEKIFQGLLYAYGYLGVENKEKGISLLEEAAMMDDVKAQVTLSLILLEEKKDVSKAFFWAQKAAEQENSDGEAALAALYIEGVGTPKDREKAYQYAQRAAQKGNADAMFYLSAYYITDKTDKAQTQAAKWIEKAAIAGSKEAMYFWAGCEQCDDSDHWLEKAAQLGYETAQNAWGLRLLEKGKIDAGLNFIRRAALQGEDEAQNNLAVIYRDGIFGVTKDYAKAERWYRRAIKQGNNDARVGLANLLFLQNDHGQYNKDILSLFNDAAKENNSMALLSLGRLYEYASNGIVEKNEVKALGCFLRIADNGNADGAFEAAKIYYNKNDYEKAFKYFSVAKDANNMEALGWLGFMYQNGLGVTKNEKQAFACFEQGAKKDDWYACGCLGDCYWFGSGTKRNYQKAVQCYQKADKDSNGESAEAALGLAHCYDSGYGLPRSAQKAKEYYEKAANLGNGEAMNWLGLKASKNDAEKAFSWYQKAAEAGDINGMYNLAMAYKLGNGVGKNKEKAHDWFVLAAQQGDADAMNQAGITSSTKKEAVEWYWKAGEAGLGWGYYNYGQTFEWQKAYLKAKEYYELAIKCGDESEGSSYYKIGCMYAEGKGVKTDNKKALLYFQKAKEKGNEEAAAKIQELQTKLAEIEQHLAELKRKKEEAERNSQLAEEYLQRGQNADTEEERARWLQSAAGLGNAVAQNYLGACYEGGYGVVQNYQRAAELYRQAAEQGNMWAQRNLGNCYYNGLGVQKNPSTAVYWYQKAAEQGNSDAQNYLGVCYGNGEGVKQNYQKAKEWYQKAIAQGNTSAQKNLDNLVALMRSNPQPQNSGCFITTAVCSSFHKSDDCYELTQFRRFRDKWLSKQKDGQALISEYYQIAPSIVANIDQRANAKCIYKKIWQNYLQPCLSFIEKKQYEACKKMYVNMVRNLQVKYNQENKSSIGGNI